MIEIKGLNAAYNDATLTHVIEGTSERAYFWLPHFNLGSDGGLIQNTNCNIIIAKFSFGRGDFAADYSVNTAN